MERDFDWDAYLAKATYSEVRNNAPGLSSDRPPTMYNPGRTRLYLPSVDVDVSTNDAAELKSVLDYILDSYRTAGTSSSHRKLSHVRTDVIELCALLSQCATDPESYFDPDAILESVLSSN